MTLADLVGILRRYSQTSKIVFLAHDGTKLISNGIVLDDFTEECAATGEDSPPVLLLDLRRLQ